MGTGWSWNNEPKRESRDIQNRNPQHDKEYYSKVYHWICRIEEDLSFLLASVQSLKSQPVDEAATQQLYYLTNETERKLHVFNYGQQLQVNIKNLQADNKKLYNENIRLTADVQRLYQELAATKQSNEHKQQRSLADRGRDRNSRSLEEPAETIQQLQQRKSTLEQIVHSHKSLITSLENQIKDLKNKISEQQREIKALSKKNDSLSLRLSKLAGQKLMENNPAIADLSDPNRPTKLGEMYSEIYDNEWTDGYEELLLAGYTDEECIETLRLTLLNILQFCQRKSETLVKKTEEAVNCLFEEFDEAKEAGNLRHMTMPRNSSDPWGGSEEKDWVSIQRRFDEDKSYIVLQPRWKPKPGAELKVEYGCESPQSLQAMKVSERSPHVIKKQLKNFRKEVAVSMVPLVQKAYLSASWSDDCLSVVKKYIKKCLLLCWMMVVQSPPLVLATCQCGEAFDKDKYKEYTRSGPKVQFVVWPAILLHEQGPVIGKGVAQGHK